MARNAAADSQGHESLIRILSRHPDPVIADKEWKPSACGTVLCSGCWDIDRSRFPKPVDVRLMSAVPNKIFGIVVQTGVSLFDARLIDQIRDDLGSYALGKCLDSDGALLPDYVTCYAKHYIVPRGGKTSKYWICKTCGTVSSQLGQDEPYVLSRYLTPGERVMMVAGGFMYLTEDLSREVDWSLWEDVELDIVPIRETPIDGQHLPGDPES